VCVNGCGVVSVNEDGHEQCPKHVEC